MDLELPASGSCGVEEKAREARRVAGVSWSGGLNSSGLMGVLAHSRIRIKSPSEGGRVEGRGFGLGSDTEAVEKLDLSSGSSTYWPCTLKRASCLESPFPLAFIALLLCWCPRPECECGSTFYVSKHLEVLHQTKKTVIMFSSCPSLPSNTFMITLKARFEFRVSGF